MSRKCNTEKFIQKAILVHKDLYDYSKVNYIDSFKKVIIICKSCNIEFYQTPAVHLRNHGCNECGKHKNHIRNVKTLEQFIIDANLIHGNKYAYDLVQYKNGSTKIEIICKKCHKNFLQLPQDHIHKIKPQGCPFCKMSKGEQKIIRILKSYNLDFSIQKTFNDCRDKKKLRFDICINSNNILLIEYQGRQHYESFYIYDDISVSSNQKRDKIKYEYCQKNNIPLLIIPYWDYNNMEDIVIKFLYNNHVILNLESINV